MPEEAPATGEPRWPMAVVVLTLIVLTVLLPTEHRVLPAWALGVVEGLLLGALIVGDPGAIDERSRLLRALSIALVSILAFSALRATGVHVLTPSGATPTSPSPSR